MNLREIFALKFTIIFSSLLTIGIQRIEANPDAKRLYDDLLSNYNRLIRPVSNNTDTVLVKLGLRLSQLIDLVSDILICFLINLQSRLLSQNQRDLKVSFEDVVKILSKLFAQNLINEKRICFL